MNTFIDILAWYFCLLVVAINIQNGNQQDLGESCYECSGVPEERDCDNKVRCGQHEKCYTQALTTDNGNVVYETGCMGVNTCKIRELANLGRKRSIVTCFKCCNGTTANGDLCNVQQCSNTQQIGVKTTRCYQCDDVDHPGDCSNVVTCNQDQECYTHMTLNQVSWRRVYKLGCLPKALCHTLEGLPHNHESTQCYHCCNSTLCNMKLCGLAALRKPDLSFTPISRTVVEGDRIKMNCEAFATSKATMSWTFQPFGGGSGTIPPYSPSNATIQFIVKPEHSGTWICTATNQAGSASANATIVVVPRVGITG